MSLRDIYEAVLTEMNKENAPNILLEDFNLFLNKAVNQYANKRYNIYEINQQVTDDLSVLKGTAIYKTSEADPGSSEGAGSEPGQLTDITYKGDLSKVLKGTYRIIFPPDYFHILNCVCTYKVAKTYRCYNEGDIFDIGAKKITADQWNQVVSNFWNKPTYRRPYYYIHYGANELKNRRNSEREAQDRTGSPQDLYCEIRIGTDKTTVFNLVQVTIDYLRVPMFYRLTQSQIDQVEDTSQTMEFPDYVCWEIINELVHIIMENVSEQRIQTHPVVSQSIANPVQQQAAE